MTTTDGADAAAAIREGRTALGIELGSTRIKACLVDADDPQHVLAVGAHAWENRYEDRMWTYSLADVWAGVQAAYAGLAADVADRHGVPPENLAAIGVSAMMHGYLAFDERGDLLVPFRTWRNTNTGPSAAVLTELFGMNIPLRWSIAHLYQAVLDEEPHVPDVRFLTTLAGYVHWRLTGRTALGIGDASGMFPIDPAADDYDARAARRSSTGSSSERALRAPHRRCAARGARRRAHAGALTAEGAALLDPRERSAPAFRSARPRATRAPAWSRRAPSRRARGTSAPARASSRWSSWSGRCDARTHELDLVTTPAGDPVAMVHCNNGASELAAWVGLFGRFATVGGGVLDPDEVFEVLFREALDGDPDAGGILAYNHLAGEPIAGLSEGRPLVVRTPDSRFTLANFMRAQLYGAFGTLALGMRVLENEGVALDRMFAHGGIFRTAGVAQRFLAGALDAPVVVAETASEGGAWGIAVLAAYLSAPADMSLDTYLRERVFADASFRTLDPDPEDVPGFAAYLTRYRAGLAVEAAAVAAL